MSTGADADGTVPDGAGTDGAATEREQRDVVRQELILRGAVPGAATDLAAAALAEAEAIGMPEFGLRLLAASDPASDAPQSAALRFTIEGAADAAGAENAGSAEGDESVASDLAVAVVEAEGVFAPIALAEAALAAADVAATQGIALRVVRCPGHLGRLAPYARAIAERGLIGLVVAGAPPVVAPQGGTGPALGTNPFAVALPTSTTPIVVDAATSALTMGKWRQLRAAGDPLPEGTAIDARGTVTLDPEAVGVLVGWGAQNAADDALGGALLPRGGALGTVTAILVEALSGGVAGMLGSSTKRRSATVIAIRGLDLEATVRDAGDDLRARLLAAGGRVPGSR